MSGSIFETARQTITYLFVKYSITKPDQFKRLARELFTQAELDEYEAAIEILDGAGELG